MLNSKRWLLHGTIKTADSDSKRKSASIIDKYSDDKNSNIYNFHLIFFSKSKL